MKSLRFLLPLLAALLVSVGFFLPWMGAAWQDRALGHTTVQYETAPQHLADLIDHLKLAANGYSVVALTQASTRLSAQQAEEAAQTALNVMAEYPLCFFSLDQLFNPSLWTLHSATPFVAVSNLSVTSSQESTPSQDYFAADTANPSAAVFWNCSFSGSTGHQLDLILDDETGKMLAFSYRIPATNTAEAAFSMEDAVQMRQFCQQYYNLDAAQFSALLPLYPPGYLLPFTDQKGEQVNLSLRTSQTSVSNSSQEKWDFFVLSFNGAGV